MALSQTGGHGDVRTRTKSVVACACCERRHCSLAYCRRCRRMPPRRAMSCVTGPPRSRS
jgi:hypothetical protein